MELTKKEVKILKSIRDGKYTVRDSIVATFKLKDKGLMYFHGPKLGLTGKGEKILKAKEVKNGKSKKG